MRTSKGNSSARTRETSKKRSSAKNRSGIKTGKPNRPQTNAGARKSRGGKSTSSKARSGIAAAEGKRSSVKAAAQKQVNRKGAVNSRNLKRVKPTRASIPRVLLLIIVFIVIGCACAVALVSQNDTAKYAACEQYRSDVEQACEDCDLDTSWTDCLLAAMVVESGGDKNVRSVLNVRGDIMQAAEGAYGWIVMRGWPEHNIIAETPEASIVAGVMEFKQSLELWEGYLGTITPNDTTEIQLVIQGYNFGADGWLAWCKDRAVRAYTVELAQEYSRTKMPEGAKGTPTHAQKWLAAYEAIRSSR